MAFFKHMHDVCGLTESAATDRILAWASDHPEFNSQVSRLNNFLKPDGGSTFLRDDRVLYDFCAHLGHRPDDHVLDGETDVGDFLAEFARKRGKDAVALGNYEGTYEVLRLGAHEIRHGEPKKVEQSYELVVRRLGRSGPHARFQYRDKENPDKPKENRVWWEGRVVATADVLYFVGVTTNYADAAMFMLWDHPEVEGIMIGVQLAKLAPDIREEDQRRYTIARRIAAIHRVQGADLDPLRARARAWLLDSPKGMVIPIDKPEAPSSLCE
jgi:hypothetical protein